LAALAVVAVSRSVSGCRDVGGQPNAKVALRALAARADLKIGTAVDAKVLKQHAGYREELAREFSSVTPENAMKWDFTEPQRGRFDFSDGDAIVGFAEQHGMRVRGHTLVWHVQNPAWLRDGHFSRAQMVDALRRHIQTVVSHFRGRVATWDVVNEILADDGSLRKSLWLRRIGPEYVAMAFRFAHQADPGATLFINEIGAEGQGPKSDALYRLVRDLRAQGVPVGGVGFESHMSLDGEPPSFPGTLQRFAALGVKVEVTEADVRVRLPASSAALDVQGADYAEALRDCASVPACSGFTVWGFTDLHSWIPENQPGYGAATVLDDKLNPKPAYRALHSALARASSARRR
jgi:endo-1,4-beta-xylanase